MVASNAEGGSSNDQGILYKEIHPPAAVSHCCQAFLTHAAPRGSQKVLPNLIVVRSTLLQIYHASSASEESCHLELTAQHALSGNVESLASLASRAPGLQRDAILLTFRDAKLVVLDWDELSGSIRTSSLHSWSSCIPGLKVSQHAFHMAPQACTDPQGRCAAVTFCGSQLAVLPGTGIDSLDAMVDSSSLTSPASLGSSYVVSLPKLGVKEVRGAAFLHRYNEPVLLLLHEAQSTWAGLYTERKDTMCITAFSLNLTHQRHLRLWHAADLPSDAHSLIPVPLGGCLVLCQSLILYHSQGASCTLAVSNLAYAGVQPPYMDINPMREAPSVTAARHATKFATNIDPEAAAKASKGAPRAEGFELDLQDACGAWLTPATLLLALATGEMVMLSLEVSAGMVAKLKLQRANECPRASCCCRVGANFVFLGSWVGDSLLLKVSSPQQKPKVLQLEGPKDVKALLTTQNGDKLPNNRNEHGVKEEAFDTDGDVEFEPADSEQGAKRQKVDIQQSKSQVPPKAEEEPEEFDEFASLFSSVETARISTLATGLTEFSFKVVDSLQGVGAIRCAAMGEATAINTLGTATLASKPHQLVLGSGMDKSGALVILQQSLVPETITEVPLAGVRGLWAVRFRPEGLPWEPDFAFHAFLLITVGRSTKVLQTGQELTEVQASQVDFVLNKPTLLAANLLSLARTVQVCSDVVVLLAGSSKQAEATVQQLLTPPEAPTGIQGEKAAVATLPANMAGVEILAASVADPYVLLHLSNGSAALLQGSLESGKLEVLAAARSVLHEVPSSDPSAHITSCALYTDASAWLASATDTQAAIFCLTTNASGLFQVYALPSMELVFDHAPITEGLATLSGDPGAEPRDAGDASEEAMQDEEDTDFGARPVVVEMRLESFASSVERVAADQNSMDGQEEPQERGMPCQRPVLILLLSNGGMLAYTAFKSPIGLRFSRLQLDWTGHSDGRGACGVSSRMTRFDGIGEGKLTYSGIFIAGNSPLWLIAARGALVPHPAHDQGSVTAMTPFNNSNCPQGFIAATSQAGKGALVIAQFPARFRLDMPWPMLKLPLKAIPHKITHIPDFDLYALLLTKQEKTRKRLPEEEGGDIQATYAYFAAEASAKMSGKEPIGQVQLISPRTWSGPWKFDLMPAETPLCAQFLTLQNVHVRQPEGLLVVGTALQYGEDYPCTGRLLLFKLVQQEAGPESSAGAWVAQTAYIREFQGPVTAVASVEGSLVVAWGARLESHKWTGVKLETTAFHEASVMVTSLSIVKRFVAYGDVHKGVTFLQMAANSGAFNSLSKDFSNCDVLHTEFIIRASSLFILAADAAKNLRVYMYNPGDENSWAGKKLLQIGAIHTGHDVGDLVSVKLKNILKDKGPSLRGALMASPDGSLSYIAPFWLDTVVGAFKQLQSALELSCKHPAGLHPRAFREQFQKIPRVAGGGEQWGEPLPPHTVLDGDLLWRFELLSHSQQIAAASATGLDKSQILAILDSAARTARFL